MRKIFTFLIACCSLMCSAQSFLGVQYGTPYDNALSHYQTKYHENCEGAGESVIIVNPKIGSCVFDCAIASFSMVDGQSVLDGGVAFKETPISQRSDLVLRQKELIGLLEQKYGADTYLEKDDDGETLYFGKTLRSDDKWLGSLAIVEKQSEGVCALVLNYSKFLASKTDDL